MMKLNRILMTSSLVLSALCLGAQTNAEVLEYDEHDVFNPHWYVQGQLGAQETLGETSFGELISPNAQIAVGYNLNPFLGFRLGVNSWQSKGIISLPEHGIDNEWKWNYVAPALNLTLDLTNLIGGYDANRKWQAGAFAGVGANIGFGNDEAQTVKNLLSANNPPLTGLRLLWDGTKVRLLGQFGLTVDYNINNNWAVGLELQANTLADGYNSKKAGNADWYFNALVGVKYTIGKKSHKEHKEVRIPTRTLYDTVYVDKVVEKIVKVPAPVEQVKPEQIRRDIFFTISKTVISDKEMVKIGEIAGYLHANPKATVHVMGYADKGTGSKSLNLRLSKERAEAVVKVLVEKFNVPADKIVIDSMDENMEQPYPDPVQNRVAICIAE